MKTGYTLPNGAKIYDTNGVYFGSLLSTGYWDSGRPPQYHYFYAYQNNGYFTNWAYDSSSGLSPHYAKSGSVYGWDGGPNANYKGTIGTFEFFTVGSSIHTVGYGSDGGTVTGTGNFTSGSTATIKAKAKTGYILTLLDGYSGTLPTKNEVSVTMRDDTTVNAYFQKCYDITFDLNGGKLNGSTSASSLTMYNLYYNSDNSTPGTNLPRDIPTKDGYSFGGWTINGRTYQAGAAIHDIGSSNSYTATAVWVRHTVSFAGLNGATPSTIAAIGGGVGDVVQLPSYNAATKPGYSIGAWTIGTTDYEPGANYTITNSDVTATAKWVSVKLRKRGTGADADTNIDAIGSLYILSSEDGYDVRISPVEITETVSGVSRKAWLFAPKPNVTYRVGCTMATSGDDRLWEFSGLTQAGSSVSEIAIGPALSNVVANANFTRKVQKVVNTGVEMLYGENFDGVTFPTGITMPITSPSTPDTPAEGKYILGTPIVATPDYPLGAVGWHLHGFRLDYFNDNGEPLGSSDDFTNPQFIAGGKANVPGDNFTQNMTVVGIFARDQFNVTRRVDEPSASSITNFQALVWNQVDQEWADINSIASRGGKARYGERVRLTANVATGYLLDGFYANGEKITEFLHDDDEDYDYVVVRGPVEFVAKAAVSVSMAIEHWDNRTNPEYEAEETSRVSVDGTEYEEHTATVVLGDTISYAVVLGNLRNIPGAGKWKFDAWYDADDADHANPIDMPSEDAAFAPTAALDIKARVVAETIVNTHTVEFKTEDASGAKTHVAALADWLTSNPVSDGKTVSADGKIELTYEGTKSVTFNFTQSVPSGGKTFAFSKVVRIAPDGVTEVDFMADPSFRVLTNRSLNLVAYYSEGGNRNISVAFANGSDRTMGTVAIVAVDGEGAEIAEGDQSATVPVGGTVTFRANPNNGYAFAGWFYSADHGGDPKYGESEVTADVVANRTLYAYFVQDTHAIYEWEGRNENKMMTWKSKVYVSPRPFNPTAIRVDATDARGLGTVVNRVEIGMMSSPDAVPAQSGLTVLTNMPNYAARRLPKRRPERYLYVEVQNDAEIDRIIVGTSMEGLAV